MPTISDLQELLKHELKDLYSAEVQLIDALPKMAERATNSKLKKAFKDHLAVTREHKNRLGKIQKILDMEKAPESKGFFANLFSSKEGEEHCKAMEGLVKEAEALMEEDMTPEVMDAALIAAAQKVEHYEISSYGTARAFAVQLKFNEVAKLLSSTLAEEYAADNSLTELAVGKVNLDAEVDPSLAGLQKNVAKATSKNKNPSKPAAKKAAPKKAVARKAAPKKSASKSPAKKSRK